MPDLDRLTFNYKELAEILVKESGIHDGLWGVYLEFSIAGANIGTSPEKKDSVPAAIVPVTKIGIQRFSEPGDLTVDAAEVNPAKKQ